MVRDVSTVAAAVAGETRRESGAWKTKHARILSAALDEFIAKGFTGASMDRIAQKAKVSKVTIYNHFEKKDLLYRQMIDYFMAQVHPGLPAIRGDLGAPRDVLLDYGIRTIEVTGHPRTLGMIRLLRADPQQFIGDGTWNESRLLPDGRGLAAYLEQETRQGRLAVDVPLLAARQLNGMLLESTIYPALLSAPLGSQSAQVPDLSQAAVTSVVTSCIETFLRRFGTR